MLTLIIIFVALVIGVAVFTYSKSSSNDEPVTIRMVYDHFKESGYLKECQNGNFKFSAALLKTLIKKESLSSIDIEDVHLAKKVKGVGKKVYGLISHLVKKYNSKDF